MVEICYVKVVVLVIGGVLKVYQYIINLDIFFGDGIVMVWCVGCWVVNFEFNQFYFIVLYYLQVCNFLLIEVLCGEGVYFKRLDGMCFMFDFDECGELVLCDIVVCVIDYEMKCFGVDCMFFDISYKFVDFICQYFLMIYEKLFGLGIDFI